MYTQTFVSLPRKKKTRLSCPFFVNNKGISSAPISKYSLRQSAVIISQKWPGHVGKFTNGMRQSYWNVERWPALSVPQNQQIPFVGNGQTGWSFLTKVIVSILWKIFACITFLFHRLPLKICLKCLLDYCNCYCFCQVPKTRCHFDSITSARWERYGLLGRSKLTFFSFKANRPF